MYKFKDQYSIIIVQFGLIDIGIIMPTCQNGAIYYKIVTVINGVSVYQGYKACLCYPIENVLSLECVK